MTFDPRFWTCSVGPVSLLIPDHGRALNLLFIGFISCRTGVFSDLGYWACSLSAGIFCRSWVSSDPGSCVGSLFAYIFCRLCVSSDPGSQAGIPIRDPALALYLFLSSVSAASLLIRDPVRALYLLLSSLGPASFPIRDPGCTLYLTMPIRHGFHEQEEVPADRHWDAMVYPQHQQGGEEAGVQQSHLRYGQGKFRGKGRILCMKS